MHAAPAIPSLLPWSAAALITHLWQSTIVGAIILVMLAAGRRLPAATRRKIAWMGLVKFVLPAAVFGPFIARVHSFAPSWPTPLVVPAAFSLRALGGGASGGGPSVPALVVGLLALAVWAAVAIGLFAFWIIRGLRLRRRILADSGPVSESVERQLMSAADRIGLWPIPHCVAVADTEGAGVMGALSSVVVIPRSLESSLTVREFKAILIHECIHEQRSDNLWSAVQAGFLCLFWFNPVVWLLSQRIAIETEKSCDEEVVRITSDPEAYCQGIIKTIRHSLGLPQPGFSGAATAPVIARLRNIGNFGARGEGLWRRRAAVTAAAAVFIFSGYAGSLAAAAIETPMRPLAREGLRNRSGFLASAPIESAISISVVALASANPEVYEVADLDQPPVPLRRISERNLAERVPGGVAGTVMVDFTVDADGTVTNPVAVNSRDREFEDSAAYAVSLWRFKPGMKRGVPVRTHLRLPVVVSTDGEADFAGGLALR